MNDDRVVQDLLLQVAEEWDEAGVLDVLCTLVKQVWQADLQRYRPDLGDDPMSLGVQASRNLCNLAIRELREVPGVLAQNRKTLEVAFDGRVLHTGKAPSDSRDWTVEHVDWAESDVRESAAAANSAAYQSTAGTLFEEWGALSGQRVDPTALRHLHLTWQGFPDGGTRTWLGFPQLGLHPWYAVMMIDDATTGPVSSGPVSTPPPIPPPAPTPPPAPAPARRPAGTATMPDFRPAGAPSPPGPRPATKHKRAGTSSEGLPRTSN